MPADNARYALNAANARWGSLFDTLYGTNIIGDEDGANKLPNGAFNPVRGKRVFDYSHAVLDEIAPLAGGYSYADARSFNVEEGGNSNMCFSAMVAVAGPTQGLHAVHLRDPSQFVGFSGDPSSTGVVVLEHNELYVILNIDRADKVGRTHPAGLADITMEAAVSTIIDFEDSVAAVDASDKARVYRNFAGLMRGDLSADLGKDRPVRRLHYDKVFQSSLNGGRDTVVLPGRSLMLCRNVGMHMYTDAVQMKTDAGEWEDVPEGFLDCWASALASLHDLNKRQETAGVKENVKSTSDEVDTRNIRNSRTGSFYIVKPKMHGPEEVASTVRLLERAEMAFQICIHHQTRHNGRRATHDSQSETMRRRGTQSYRVHQHWVS